MLASQLRQFPLCYVSADSSKIMWMLVLVLATKASLSAVLMRNDGSITDDIIWPDKAACDVAREAHLFKHPAPDNAGLICLQVPDHIAKKYLPAKKPMVGA